MDRESTQDRTTNLHSRLMLGTALVTSVFLGGYSRRAYAQCAPSTPGTYDCSGTLTTTQTLNGAPLTVTTDPDFSIDTTGTGGNALTLVGTGGIDFTNVNGSAITAANTGVDARNVGGGALTITTTGVVTGTNGDGIYARTDSSSTDLTINATDVSGLGYGISADNNGSGALSITTTGTVTGTNDGGIYALTGSYSTDLTIEAADVSGGEDGIYISHRGAGSVTITATGTVTGTGSSDGYGIQASSWGAASTDLTINAADVSGAYGGIIAWHSATGAVAITTTGTVTGNGSGNYAAGIFVGAYSGTGVTIDAVDVSGDRGVAVKQQGTGALSITSTGAVTGTGGDGIYAHNYASGTDLTIDVADVDGTNNGVHAVNEGSGALSITTTGTVTGNNSAGIFASNESAVPGSTTTVAVESGSTVSGATAGVAVASATGRAASVTNSGTISGTGGATGIIGTGTGPVAITNTGAITSTGTAIDLAAVGTANTINQQAGAITGDILLSAAADQLTVTGGAISGNVVGQGLANVDFDLGAGAFTFDGPFAITGADNVAVHSGLVTMDGSFDALTLDVDGGRLVVNSTSTATNGSTVQSGGILAVNGTLNGATNVLAGGLLQGGGIIGGDVVIADGGAIGPGGVGDVAGTLTVNGNLTLNQGSDLNYNFGQANVVGGSLNDLLNVGGDLVLDGTLNITATVGGTFGAGIYRVINYGGALTNNGLDVTSSDHIVQTSVAGQVNLINTGGLTISFWDGDLGPKYNGMVDGGSGTWQATGGDNWTDATGVVNAPISNNAFAVFAGAAGTVTVDDSQGGVSAAGMQFATDGYVITGDSVTLASPQSVIRVGDGSAAGAAYTATINSVLGGTGVQLVKTDLGTLVLTGANTHSGGTLVDEGTLRISSDANLGAAAGGLAFDGGTLNTTADISSIRAVDLAGSGTFLTDAGTTLRLGGAISGAGALTKDGAGALVLTGAGSHAGGTTIAVGTLQLGDGGTTGSITGDIINNAALVTNRSDVLFLDGSISGSGSLTQAGGGVLILTADNSYTGGTTIASGSLSIGNGGTTGNIVGDVANNGNLGFARSDTLTFAGTISGSGSVTQQAPGTTILTGTNSYGGETRIAAGTLLVNGDQAAATGITNVLGNTTLGGVGTIGGDVVVADGGTLAPGAGGAGALTINGSLSLASGSQLAYDFGAANAPGNPLNDVVNVGGDLTLDGTINVAVMAGGAFDIGLYRIANYGGALTDNGLAIGTLPAGADVFVQTSVANQVNLINTGGFTISYWDGDAGPKFNGAIDGGSGTWQATGGDDWTDATGRVNAPISNNAFAVFAGAAGTVTIDNSLGAVTASGLQFATDGYAIAGGALTLTGPQSVIRVGDGTAAGAGYTATIRTELTGATQLVKTDAGTLVLTGTNSHTGGTAINGGTVRIASDGNLGAAAGGLSLNGGTLNTAADLSSARAVDLAGAGTFLTDAGSTLTLTGAMSGAGSLAKAGTGTLVLAGTGGHTGTTAVGAGTLLVNGNYAGATGPTSVASGASLGGTGTIGGDVSLASGAALTPGAGGAGTLTINGDLSLASGTRLAFEFGQAGAAGGALNDLVNVGGDLVLDGTIDVRVPAGGAFEVGVYRAFNYGGALTNNGLTLGTLPAGSALFVQTSIAGQVNLVNSAGLTLNFWDGAAGPKNNGVINGGTGTWQNSAGNDNWADAIGAVNAAYTDGAFAIFGGTGGTVTVDNSLGQVTAAGMQFAANGYTITGNAIALTTPQSIIRVGDGSTAGAGFTATINAPLSGDTQLVKTDAGTLVLGGTNSYTGGTLINGGTVQVSADANLGAASSNVTLDGGTLATSGNMTSARDIVMAGAGTISTASGTTFTYTGGLSGTGALTTAGTGTLLLTGDSSAYAGSTRVAGTLSVNGSLCGDMNVTETGRLQGTGTVCTTVNAGAVAPGNSIGTLTVAGDYTGIGGTLEIEAELGGDASPTDQLVVTGNTFGSTEVVVINTGGLGAQTVEGIKIVDVGGTSAGTFTLDGDYTFDGSPTVIAGAYGYRLFQGGVATPTDGDWYLRSALLGGPGEPTGPLYQPGVPLYESYASTLQTLSDLPTLQERVGNRQWSGITQGGIGMWGRIEGARHRPNAAISTSGTDINTNTWGLQFGFEAAIVEADAGVLIAGVNGRYGTADARVQSRFGNGEIETKGFGVGATLTWYGNGGLYVDAQAQLSWFDSDLDSSVLGNLVDDSDGSGEAFSLEVGQRLPLGASLSITPQAQITYSKVRFDGFVDPNGAAVAIDDGDSLLGRVAVSLDHEYSWTQSNGGTARNHLYGIVSLEYEMLDGTRVDVSGTPLLHRDYRLRSELGFGISHTWDGDRFTIFSEVSASTALADFGKSNGLRGNAGFRMKF